MREVVDGGDERARVEDVLDQLDEPVGSLVRRTRASERVVQTRLAVRGEQDLLGVGDPTMSTKNVLVGSSRRPNEMLSCCYSPCLCFHQSN